jgi:glycosyltransferase involved in cell wall biosynthesis
VIGHRLALAYLRSSDDPPLDDDLAARVEMIMEVRRALPITRLDRWRRRVRLLVGAARLRPMLATDMHADDFTRGLSELVTRFKPDIIQVEYQVMAQYLSAVPDWSAKRVMTVHDPAFAAALQRSSQGGLAWPINVVDAGAWWFFERDAIRQVDAVVVFTEQDREAISKLDPSARVEVIRLAPPLRETPLDPIGQNGSLLFVGNMVHEPNVDAARRLIVRIFPRVQASYPEARLVIVGADPPTELVQLARRRSNTTIAGWIQDLEPYLDRAAVIVAPLRHGGGMRVKVLDALAAGKAIVASSLALSGTGVEDGRDVIVAETDDDVVAGIIRLLRDPLLRRTLGSNARRWAEREAPRSSATAYEALYRQLLTSR